MKNLIEGLSEMALSNANKCAFVLLKKEKRTITYGELYARSKRMASIIQPQVDKEPVLLLFDNSLDFLVAFLACQMSGAIAIPMFYPKNKRYFERLNIIIIDSDCRLVLCEELTKNKIQRGFLEQDINVKLLGLDFNYSDTESIEFEHKVNPISFIQYTSGSTGDPKGVIVSQKNIIHNQKLISETFECDRNSVILSWLPFYHDMGLIGNLLHSIYVGSTCVIIPPVDVLQTPLVWMKAIEEYGVTHSGGPNFIYDHCIEKINDEAIQDLNLSSWKVAYNGSETVKKKTVEQFVRKFSKAKFSKDAFKACYGLAEATLIVSGGAPKMNGEFLSSGKICNDLDVVFYNERTGDLNKTEGEICVSGDSITDGYWRKDSSDFFIVHEAKKYLRTGDTGRLLEGELMVTGRLKELVIINGRNFYPYDLESEIASQLNEISENGVVVSYISNEKEEPLIFAEVNRAYLNTNLDDIVRKIDRLIIENVGVPAYDIVLLLPRKLARTSSGKLQRLKVKQEYLENQLEFLSNKRKEVSACLEKENEMFRLIQEGDHSPELMEEFLLKLIARKLAINEKDAYLIKEGTLMDHGVSSLMAVELVNEINYHLNIYLEVSDLMQLNYFDAIKDHVLNLIWMSTKPKDLQEEITI
ncbi:MAG: AMP-binding protein [Crocinitomix sp.]|nr:AMP-binding protein [Crocinitomix sp.]